MSDNQEITFTTKTKKELSSQTYEHYGEIVTDNESIGIGIVFNHECTIYHNNGEIIATGKYSYRKFAGKVIVKLEFIEDDYKNLFDDNTIIFTKLKEESN